MNTSKLKRSLAGLLILVMVLTLFPPMTIHAVAEDAASQQPVLNQTIVGTVDFQSFNFLGDNASGSDGVDYKSTFYYTDDFFSPSAVNPNADSKSEDWTELTDTELSLASTSFDLTVAAYASNDDNVLSATSRSWDNTDYSKKDKNAKAMLETCGFENFESFGTYNQAPTNDSIAYVIANKTIKVWDEHTRANKEFTLVAVAVRGAGYGAEWAGNVTIGNPSSSAMPPNGRHYGFDQAANTVCSSIRAYLSEHNISSDVKYWITGFSRAGATANLVAANVTDGAENIYHTHQRDVYGYTWECPQAASTSENALNYKNIHNILNAMDAVPKVSPDEFQHQRLGVDYVMPYHGNTNEAENEAYYANMREVLQTIAVGAYNYAGKSYTEDPLISVTDPSNYPYNRPMTIYTITATKLIGDAISGDLMNNFGTTEATGSNRKLSDRLYIDQFIDDLINVFLTSQAWIGQVGGSRQPLQNRTTFLQDYQRDFRNVLGYLLDYSGPAFLGLLNTMVDAIGEQLSLSNVITNGGLALAFTNFYSDPTGSYSRLNILVGDWRGKPKRTVLISEAQPVVRNIVRNMTTGFTDPQRISREQFESSLDHLVELVINLYADELSRYNSNFFGTSLHYMWQILCTHEQEVVMSWIKSLDPNHMNRGYRTLTVPKTTDVKLYEFRDWFADYEGTLSTDGMGALVAEYRNGKAVKITAPDGRQVDNLDQRISISADGANMIIRYPSLLDIRLDISAMDEDTYFEDVDFQVADYRTQTATTALSDGYDQYDPQKTKPSNYTSVATANTNAGTINGFNFLTVPLSCHDVLQIMANGTTTYDNSANADKQVYDINKLVYANTVVEGQFVKENGGETYYPYVTDFNGEEKQASEIEAEVLYSSTRGSTTPETGNGNENPNAHVGSTITATVPIIENDNKVEKYFVTDSRKENNRKLSGTEPFLPADLISDETDSFTCNTGSSKEEILSAEDQVYHVYYAGDLSYSFTLVHQDGTEEPVKIDRAYQGIDITENVRDGMMYGGLFEDAAFETAAKTPGTKLRPTEKKYYLKEVPKTYFYTRNIATTQGGQVLGSYAVAVADDPNYQEVGFIYKNRPIPSMEKEGNSSLYESVTFNNVQGHSSNTLLPSDFMENPESTSESAVIAIARVDDVANGEVQAYWITADGVKVIGDNVRTLENGRKSTTIADDTGRYEISKDAVTTVYESAMPVYSIYVINDEDEEIPTDTGVKLAGYTTSLNGNIAMNFYMDLSEEVAADKNAYMQFTLPGGNTTAEKVMLSDAVKQTRNGKTYYVFSAGVAAKEMTSDIKAQFVKGDGTKSPVWTYTIKQYCDYIRNHEEAYDAESIALAENMLLYGGNAQRYFNHNMDKLADADVDIALPEVDLDASFDPVVKGSCEGLTYLGSSAMLTTTTGLRHYFELAGNAGDYTFTANGKKLTVESDKNGKYVLIDNIKAKDLKKPITLKVTDKSGNEFTLTYSVYTNIKQVLNGDFAEADKNLMKALYGYGEAAEDYFVSR